MSFLWTFFKYKWITPAKPVNEDYSGRNVIVTGATSGIGYEAVYKFAALGAKKVIMTARDRQKGELAKAALEKRLGRIGQLEVWELDMMSYDSVMAFAKRANELDHLDIAILNAGIRRMSYSLSKHGWEEDLQVNTLSNTLLGILLLPKLKESRREGGKIPVLEFVNSGLHRRAIVSPEVQQAPNILEYYNKRERFKEGNQYKFSKVFLMYATNKLAEEVSSGEAIVTSVCPGAVKTDLGRDHYFPGVFILAWLFLFLFLRSPSVGANIIMSGTTQGEQAAGRFWRHDEIQPIPPSVAGPDMRELGLRIWNEIVTVLKKDAPDVTEALDSLKARG